MRLGEMIKEYREARGMSQRAFARKCGLSNGQIAFLERGIGNSGKPFEPTFDTLRKVARAIGTYPEYLMKNVLWKTTVDHFSVRGRTVTIAFDSQKVLAERMAILTDSAGTASDRDPDYGLE